MGPLHESFFAPIQRRLKAPAVGKKVLNRSFTPVNSLFPRIFSLSERKIFRAKVSEYRG